MKEVTRSTIKWVAMLTMLIDHTRFTLVLANTMQARVIRECVMCVGRIAFPLFGFLLVDGFFRTRSKADYFLRIFISALISEVPYDLMRDRMPICNGHQNVLWTLLFAFGAMWISEAVMERYRDRKDKRVQCILLLALISVAACALAYVVHTDYGLYGVGAILIMFYCKIIERKMPGGFPISANIAGYMAGVMLLVAVSEYEVVALTGLILIRHYKGHPGKKIPMDISYGFYPLHILVLLLASGLIYPQLNIFKLITDFFA